MTGLLRMASALAFAVAAFSAGPAGAGPAGAGPASAELASADFASADFASTDLANAGLASAGRVRTVAATGAVAKTALRASLTRAVHRDPRPFAHGLQSAATPAKKAGAPAALPDFTSPLKRRRMAMPAIPSGDYAF